MPSPRPSPAATMMVMETMPQAMPNMVRSVRRLCAHRVASVSRNRSRKDTGVLRLLQDDVLFFGQAREDFRLDAVRNAQFNADFFLPFIALGVGDFHLRVAVFVVNHGRFGTHQDVLL